MKRLEKKKRVRPLEAVEKWWSRAFAAVTPRPLAYAATPSRRTRLPSSSVKREAGDSLSDSAAVSRCYNPRAFQQPLYSKQVERQRPLRLEQRRRVSQGLGSTRSG